VFYIHGREQSAVFGCGYLYLLPGMLSEDLDDCLVSGHRISELRGLLSDDDHDWFNTSVIP
jgi:hypothetical protein